MNDFPFRLRSLVEREVRPEWLDQLPPGDPDAIRSRRDLQRLNFLMGHARLTARLLDTARVHPIRRLIELGAGDGTFLLRLARRLAPRWGQVKAILVDRQDIVSSATRQEFQQLGWKVEVIAADVFQWLAQTLPQQGTVMLANLFLHHFQEQELRAMLRQIAGKTDAFVACEPRRWSFALRASRLVGLMGGNRVTRHDAPASVRSGFTGRELSKLWPSDLRWRLQESSAGLFSHFFLGYKEASCGDR